MNKKKIEKKNNIVSFPSKLSPFNEKYISSLLIFLVSMDTPADEANKECNFLVSNLILLQYTKEKSIFASCYNNWF